MAKKIGRNVLPRIDDVTGWILICKDEDSTAWHIAWLDVFGSRKAALAFATNNNWPGPYRAVRGKLLVDHQ